MAVKLMLAQVRTRRGMTQEEVAQAMNMSLGGIQYLEYNAKTIKFDLLDQLCQVLDCEPGDLLKRFADQSENESRAYKEKQRQKKSERMKRYWAEKKQRESQQRNQDAI